MAGDLDLGYRCAGTHSPTERLVDAEVVDQHLQQNRHHRGLALHRSRGRVIWLRTADPAAARKALSTSAKRRYSVASEGRPRKGKADRTKPIHLEARPLIMAHIEQILSFLFIGV